MASSRLLAPPVLDLSYNRAVASLDAHFASLDQLHELEVAVLQAQSRHNDLQHKCNASQTSLNSYLAVTRSSADAYLSTAQELSHSRHTLSDELSQLSKDLVSVLSDEGGQPTLLEDLESLQRNLKELESVKLYVKVIEHSLSLSEKAVKDIQSATSITPESLQQYGALLHFVNKTQTATSSVEDGNGRQKLHLNTFLEHLRDKTWHDIKAVLFNSIAISAEELGWPTIIDYATCMPQKRDAFEASFLKLVSLQLLGRKLHKRADIQSNEKERIYAIEALALPVSLRFKYHYDGSHQTNRLDKPEWYLTYILNIAHDHHHFMDTVVQRLLARSEYKSISAWNEFALALLPILSKKLKKAVPRLLSHPSLFAHTIYQTLIFDAALIEEGFKIENTSAADDSNDRWQGISEVILGNPGWFNAWLQAEKKFIEDQYQEIVSASDAWAIADEGEEEIIARDVKATNSARRIRALVNQIIDRSSPLPSSNERAQFLIMVQLPVLHSYRARITSALDAFETISFAFVRAVPGALSIGLSGKDEASVHVDAQNLTSGIEGVQRLCKALVSATYIHASLEAWTEEVFFIELWQEILRDPFLRKQAEGCALLPKTGPSNAYGDVARETVFQEMIAQYQIILTRAEDMTVQQVCGEIEAGLRPHFNASTGSADSEDAAIGISQTLLGPIALLCSHLAVLRQTLPLFTFATLYRRIAVRLAEHILQRLIVYRGSFSKREGATLQAECELWVESCHATLEGVLGGGRHRIEAPWVKLLQAGRLVGADGSAWESITGSTFGAQSEEDWEKVMLETTRLLGLGREDVSRLLRRRDDCP